MFFFEEFLNSELPFIVNLNDYFYKKIVISDIESFVLYENKEIHIETAKINKDVLLINDNIIVHLKKMSKKDLLFLEFILNKYLHN